MIHEKLHIGLKIEAYPKEPIGGQSIHRLIPGVKLTHEELGFEVIINFHRSSLKNKQTALDLFEKYCETLDLELYLKV